MFVGPCAAATWTQSSMRRPSGTTKRSTSCRKVEVRSATVLCLQYGLALCYSVQLTAVSVSVYIMCVLFVLLSTLNCMVGTLEIAIIIAITGDF